MKTTIRCTLLLATLLLAACGVGNNQALVSTPASSPPQPSAASSVTQASAAASVAASPSATAPPQPTSTLVPTEAPATSAPEPTAAPTDEPTTEVTITTEPGSPPAAGASAAPLPSPGGAVAVQPGADGIAIVNGRGGTIAFTRDAGIWAYRPATGAIEVLVEDGSKPRFSPDGTQLAFVRSDGVYLARADGSDARRIAEQDGADAIAWADDASKLLWTRRTAPDVAHNVGELWSVEFPAGQPVKLGDGMDAAWAPDGKRVAYVTPWPQDSSAGPRRNELRLVNWQGKNGWTVVSQLPPETPPIGIPGSERPPAELEHLMFTPLWTPTADAIIVPALVTMQVETDFNILERANPFKGGSTFLSEDRIGPATGSPNRQAAVFVTGSARGDVQLIPRTLDPARSEDYAWAATGNDLAIYDAPAWAPASDAIAAYRCALEQADRCDLVLLAPGLEAPATLVPDVFDGRGIDFSQPPGLAWGRS